MSKLNSLNLPETEDDAAPPADYDNMPAQGGGRTEPLQPGTYEFALPPEPSSFENIATDKGPRISATFEDANQLTVVGRGRQLKWTVKDIERQFKNGPVPSDFDYLLAAVKSKPANNTRLAKGQALEAACAAGATFIADVDLSGYCNPKNPIWDGEKRLTKVGCGARFGNRSYTRNDGTQVKQLPKDESGAFVTEVTCGDKCGAVVSMFNNLSRIRAKA